MANRQIMLRATVQAVYRALSLEAAEPELIGKLAVRGRADTNPSRALSGGRRSPMVLGDRRELEGYIIGPALPQVLDQDWRNSYANGGRSIFGWEPPPKRIRLG